MQAWFISMKKECLMKSLKHRWIGALCALGMVTGVGAAPLTYTVDEAHTFPRFSYSHFGLSTQLSSFSKTRGTVVFDEQAQTGKVDITIDMSSVQTGSTEFNRHIQGPEFLDTARFPTATFQSTAVVFEGGQPRRIDGLLTIKGITRPVSLTVTSFLSMPHPMLKKPAVGANAFILPDVDNTQYLGSTTKRWHTLYVGPGSINIDGVSISKETNKIKLSHALKFSDGTSQSTAPSISTLAGINIVDPTANQILAYDGTGWTNVTPAGGTASQVFAPQALSDLGAVYAETNLNTIEDLGLVTDTIQFVYDLGQLRLDGIVSLNNLDQSVKSDYTSFALIFGF
jgi:polyisoprenoid-binding protein YceI